jgi:hypothetical protein
MADSEEDITSLTLNPNRMLLYIYRFRQGCYIADSDYR